MAQDSHPQVGPVSCCSLLLLREVSVQCGWGQMRVWCQVRSQGKMMRWILFHMQVAAQAVDCVGLGGGWHWDRGWKIVNVLILILLVNVLWLWLMIRSEATAMHFSCQSGTWTV